MSNLKLQACSTPLCSEQNTSKRNPSERDREGSNNALKLDSKRKNRYSWAQWSKGFMRVKRGIRMLKCFSAVRIKAGWCEADVFLWETDSSERNVFPWEKLKESRNHEVCVTEMLCFLFPQTHTKIGHQMWARSLRLVSECWAPETEKQKTDCTQSNQHNIWGDGQTALSLELLHNVSVQDFTIHLL